MTKNKSTSEREKPILLLAHLSILVLLRSNPHLTLTSEGFASILNFFSYFYLLPFLYIFLRKFTLNYSVK